MQKISEKIFDECVINNFEQTVKRLYPNAENFRYTEADGRIVNLSCEVNSEHVVELINHNFDDYSWSVHRKTVEGSCYGYSAFSLELALENAKLNFS